MVETQQVAATHRVGAAFFHALDKRSSNSRSKRGNIGFTEVVKKVAWLVKRTEFSDEFSYQWRLLSVPNRVVTCGNCLRRMEKGFNNDQVEDDVQSTAPSSAFRSSRQCIIAGALPMEMSLMLLDLQVLRT